MKGHTSGRPGARGADPQAPACVPPWGPGSSRSPVACGAAANSSVTPRSGRRPVLCVLQTACTLCGPGSEAMAPDAHREGQARGPGGRRGRTRAGGMRAGGGATQLQLASAWGPPQEACLPAASPTLASQIREVQRLNGQRARINPKGRWTRVWGRADPRPLQNSSPCPGTAGWDGPQWAAPCYWQEARAGRGGPRYARSPSSVRRGCCFGSFRKCD